MKLLKDKDIQLLLARVLLTGTILSMVFVLAGGALFLYRHGHSLSNYHTFKGVPAFVQHASGLIGGVEAFKGQAMIQFGVVLLIATPIVRVIFSAIGFALEKDYLYIGIC